MKAIRLERGGPVHDDDQRVHVPVEFHPDGARLIQNLLQRWRWPTQRLRVRPSRRRFLRNCGRVVWVVFVTHRTRTQQSLPSLVVTMSTSLVGRSW